MSIFRRRSLAPAGAATMSPPLSPKGSGNASPPPSGQSARRRPTRIGSLHVGLIVAAVALVLLVVFLVQNARTVDVSFLGGHLRVSLAVAMLIASLVGGLIMGAAGTARIGQLRRSARRDSRTT
jgi:putative membrane protein